VLQAKLNKLINRNKQEGYKILVLKKVMTMGYALFLYQKKKAMTTMKIKE
jgi:hypothetical protein